MADVLFEKVTNPAGARWIRSHAINMDHFAICTHTLYPGVDNVTEGTGEITCPDCVDVIERCKKISENDLAPEYRNELFHRRLDR